MNLSLDDFRDAKLVRNALAELHHVMTRPWVIMEICGGQTHAIMQYGLDQLLPSGLELVHGPGCPVCVTPLELVDKAISIASQPEVIFCSFGDMLRVPGSQKDLFSVRAAGGNVRVVYSPLDAVKIAQENPEKQVVFFAIGFETTAPVNAASVLQAQNLGLKNFSILVSQVCVPPAMEAILSSPENRVQGFLAAGHVCSIMGYWEYHPIAKKYEIPIVVTGFEPLDLVIGITRCVSQLENSLHRVENAYERVVTEKGNLPAQQMIDRVYMPVDRNWRGIGMIPLSGWGLRPEYADFNAENRFDTSSIVVHESEICIAGEILRGIKEAHSLPGFSCPLRSNPTPGCTDGLL